MSSVKSKKSVKKSDNSKKIKLGKSDFVALIFLFVVILYFISPKMLVISTGKYNAGTEQNQKDVVNALGKDNTQEKFELYFQYYNVVHELGHGLLKSNDGVKLAIVDEEQLVNDFAVAYWNYYGEKEGMEDLKDLVDYAVVHVGDNYENGVDYMELGRANSTKKSFNRDFFTFNDYGYFQFSSVKHSIEQNKSLDEVLKEMGFKDYKLPEAKTLVYEELGEETSNQIIEDAVANFKSWGLDYLPYKHVFNKDPNMNYCGTSRDFLGIRRIINKIKK